MSDGHRSGRSTGRVSCKSMELKRCSMIEMRWNKYEVSLASSARTQIRRPSLEIKFRVVELKTPRFSTAIIIVVIILLGWAGRCPKTKIARFPRRIRSLINTRFLGLPTQVHTPNSTSIASSRSIYPSLQGSRLWPTVTHKHETSEIIGRVLRCAKRGGLIICLRCS